MYFSPNKKPSERRAGDEYLRRASFGIRPAAESRPTAAPPADATPAEEETLCPVCQNRVATPSLAMVYAPKQAFQDLYEPETALARGTLFAELDLPFEGRSVKQK